MKEDAPTKKEKKKADEKTTSEKNSILIVDDDTFLLDMYSVKFKEKGFDVSLALSSRDALVMLEEGLEPSVIALDIVMPTMDGLELLEKIVKDGLAKDSVIVMLTNQSSQPNIDRALELGAKDYIVKASAIPSEVYEKIKTLLDKYKK